ncbi:MAG: segregation and condensation protein A [bacterium]
MSDNPDTKEQQIMMMMRKTLTGIIRDTTPEPGMRHPLNERSLSDIRDCLMMISARERELAEHNGVVSNMRPRYVDEPQTSSVVPFSSIGRANSGDEERED